MTDVTVDSSVPSICASPLLASLFRPRDCALPVIDPELKHLGRFWIDLRKIIKTYGLARYQTNHPHPPSLCLLYQEGRCNAGAKCNQIHVKRSHMKNLHKAIYAQQVTNCCVEHGDLGAGRQDIRTFLLEHQVEVKLQDGTIVPIPPNHIAITNHWERCLVTCLPAATITVPSTRICNLHQQNECRYGVDCRNVHICREIWQAYCCDDVESHGLSLVSSPPDCADSFLDMDSDKHLEMEANAVVSDILQDTPRPPAPTEGKKVEFMPLIAGHDDALLLSHEPGVSWGLTEGCRGSSIIRNSSSSSLAQGLRSTDSIDTLTSPATPLTRLLGSFTRVFANVISDEKCRLGTYLQCAAKAQGAEESPFEADEPMKAANPKASAPRPMGSSTGHQQKWHPRYTQGWDHPRYVPSGDHSRHSPSGDFHHSHGYGEAGPKVDSQVRRPKVLHSAGPHQQHPVAQWNRSNLFGAGLVASSMGTYSATRPMH
eukprot:GGOE01012601.1.p1 GENE.GGOE01012601.1~~GGOE01012601.1.p1  ORF type:complete len:495 (-),score=83.86 GGOE01012601.1:2499-3953(-)